MSRSPRRSPFKRAVRAAALLFRNDAPPPLTDRELRQAFLKRARRLTPFVAVESEGLLFFVSTRDKLGRKVFVERERQDMVVLADALRLLGQHGAEVRRPMFVDVGANLGTTTVTAMKRHGFTSAVALEPEPTNFRTLRLNLVANDLDSEVTALCVAASDRAGEGRLEISSRSSGTHSLVDTADAAADGTIGVRTVTLDELVDEGTIAADEVGLLWVDTPDAEATVLAGASTLLRRGVPLVAAVRADRPAWPKARSELIRLLGGYTHFASLRPDPALSQDLPSILDAFTRAGDFLAFRA